MKLKFNTNLLAPVVLISVILCAYLGISFSSYLYVLLVSLILLILHIITVPTGSYNKGTGWVNKPIFMMYTINEILQQLLLYLAIFSIVYLLSNFIYKLLLVAENA